MCDSRVCVLVFMTLAASYALPTPDAIVPEMDFFDNDANALPTPDDVVPETLSEMTMTVAAMEHSQMPVMDEMEEAGTGQGHGSGEEPDKMEEAGTGQGHGSGEEPASILLSGSATMGQGHGSGEEPENHHHCQGGEQADGTFGLCMGSGDCRHSNNHCLEGACNQEDGICKATQGENSGHDGDGGEGGEGGEDMAVLLPYIQKCQAKLPAGDMCKTLDPMMCAHADPPPASCEECKSRLMGCVHDAAGMGAGEGSGEGPDEGPEHDAGQGSGEGSEDGGFDGGSATTDTPSAYVAMFSRNVPPSTSFGGSATTE